MSMKKVFIVALFFYGCSENVERNSLSIPNFYSEGWKQDSLACNGLRETYIHLMSDTFTKKMFIGVRKEDVINTLVFPNFTYFHMQDSMYAYFMSKGQQCYNKEWRERNFTDAEQLIFFISSDGLVTSVLGVISP